MSARDLGVHGEKLACDYLKRKNYQVIETNFRVRSGEIDIIASRKNILCFVEVKTRVNVAQGQPYESLTPHKIRTLIHTAKLYMQWRETNYEAYQFDVLSILMGPRGDAKIEHIENAFQEEGAEW